MPDKLGPGPQTPLERALGWGMEAAGVPLVPQAFGTAQDAWSGRLAEALTGAGGLAMALAPMALGIRAPGAPRPLFSGEARFAEIPHDPAYLYHATARDRLFGMADSGKMTPFKPNYGTDQLAWPDGGIERRNYWAEHPGAAEPFIPDFPAAIVRTRRDAAGAKNERGTKDLYTNKPIPLKALEYWDGAEWRPMTDLK